MKLSELIRKREVATLTVATHATDTPIHPQSVATVASVNVATEKGGKPKTLLDKQGEARRQKVIAMLEASPSTRYAVCVADVSIDPVIATVGIRDVTTFELAIPRHSYDSMVLLELIEKHYGRNYANN